VQDQLQRAGLTFERDWEEKRGDELTCVWIARGSPEAHQQLMDLMLADPQVLAFEGSLPG
jgi:hypothetical protein